MEKSKLIPFTRASLEILFLGLNPSNGSSVNGHYFSVWQAFWSQLFESGLITENVNKINADKIIFGGTDKNLNSWNYSVLDLITEIAECDSRKLHPTKIDCINFKTVIKKLAPKTAVTLHSKYKENY